MGQRQVQRPLLRNNQENNNNNEGEIVEIVEIVAVERQVAAAPINHNHDND